MSSLAANIHAFRAHMFGSLTPKQNHSAAKPTYPSYPDSVGQQLSNIGDKKRWVLAGSALEVWEKDLEIRIDELIRENEGEIYKGENIRCMSTSRHCWIVGRDISSARPTVVISCSVDRILKRTLRVISRHEILKAKGFELKGFSSCDVQLLTAPSAAHLKKNLDTLFQGLPISLCGAEVEVDNPMHHATLGGVVILNGRYYGVTVAHAFSEEAQNYRPIGHHETQGILYDIDWADSLSEDEGVSPENGHHTAASHPPPLDEVGDGIRRLLATAGVTASLYLDTGLYDVTATSSTHPMCDVEGALFDDMDWAVIEISNPVYHGINGVLLGRARKWLYFENFKKNVPQNSVIVATRNGFVKGIAAGSASSINLYGSSRYRKVWSIQLDGNPLELGDSGSWVVDADTGDVYGMLIAASAILQEGYMIPIWQVFKDIVDRTGIQMSDFKLPTVNDTLTLASQFGNRRLIQSLLEAGADASFIDERPTQNWPAESNSSLFDALHARGADVLCLDKNLNRKKSEESRGADADVLSLDPKRKKPEESSSNLSPLERWHAQSSRDVPSLDPNRKLPEESSLPLERWLSSRDEPWSGTSMRTSPKSGQGTGGRL